MTAGSSETNAARRPRRAAKGERKTKSRFSQLSGGEASQELETQHDNAAGDVTTGDGDAGGITAGLAMIDGHTVVQMPVEQIAPHPFNDAERSAPQPGSSKWDELVGSIRENGVKVPGLLVTAKRFLDVRPQFANDIGTAEFVVIYGHRRRAAVIEAARDTMPVVVDDATMDDNGDLDAMTLENLGREDLSPLAEARMFARYSELGLGQRAIAEKLGIDQGTVSRRLALLLLVDEVQRAVDDDTLPSAAGAALAGTLPAGPHRPWQRKRDPEQDTDQRRHEQLAAYQLIVSGWTPSRATERIVAERHAREQAASEDLEVIDPAAKLGSQHHEHQLFDTDAIAAAKANDTLLTAIDPHQGNLTYYSSAKPKLAQRDEADDRKAAKTARRMACVKLIASVPGKNELAAILIDQVVDGLAGLGTSAQGWDLAHRWSRSAGISQSSSKDEYQHQASREFDPRKRAEFAWRAAIAAFELHATAGRPWSQPEITYMDLLSQRVGYEPTAWERAQIEQARRNDSTNVDADQRDIEQTEDRATE